jgi:hypothetical protein
LLNEIELLSLMRYTIATMALAALLSSCSTAPRVPERIVNGKTLIVGDSITNGARSYLKKYCPGADVEAADGMSVEWMRDRIVDRLSKESYGTVFVMGGINNVTGGAQTPQITGTIDDIATVVRKKGAQPMFGTITPFKGYTAGGSSWSARKQDIADAVNAHIRRYHFRDTYAVLGASWDKSSLSPRYERTEKVDHAHPDHLHPGDAGMDRLAREIANAACRY